MEWLHWCKLRQSVECKMHKLEMKEIHDWGDRRSSHLFLNNSVIYSKFCIFNCCHTWLDLTSLYLTYISLRGCCFWLLILEAKTIYTCYNKPSKCYGIHASSALAILTNFYHIYLIRYNFIVLTLPSCLTSWILLHNVRHMAKSKGFRLTWVACLPGVQCLGQALLNTHVQFPVMNEV